MPRLHLAHDAQCGVQSYGDAVLAVEETADSPDPLTYLAEYEVTMQALNDQVMIEWGC